MKLIETKPGDAYFSLFEELPRRLYAADSPRHRQTDSLSEEYLYTCLVLTQHAEPVARVAIYQNPHLTYQGMPAACIGNYECIADPLVAATLLTQAIQQVRMRGIGFLIGPMNGSTWNSYRFSMHHQHPNFLLEPYHHLYYNDQFLAAGFVPISTYTSSLDRDIPLGSPQVLENDARFQKLGVQIRPLDTHRYEAELRHLFPLLSIAFNNNFLFTPTSWEAFHARYLAATPLIHPDYVHIADDKDGQAVGLIFCYRDQYNTHEKSLVVKTIARHPDPKWTGLGHVLGNRITQQARQDGYQSLIHAFMINQGHATTISRNFQGTVYKNYTLYGQKL